VHNLSCTTSRAIPQYNPKYIYRPDRRSKPSKSLLYTLVAMSFPFIMSFEYSRDECVAAVPDYYKFVRGRNLQTLYARYRAFIRSLGGRNRVCIGKGGVWRSCSGGFMRSIRNIRGIIVSR
jgi:hypothetical protein